MSEPQWQTCPKCGERWWDSHVCRNTLNSLTVALAPTCRFCGQASRAHPAQAGQVHCPNGDKCKHGSWCSETYCQEHCQFRQAGQVLSNEEIDAAYEKARADYQRSRFAVRGQQLTAQDSPDWWFARAIEQAVLAKRVPQWTATSDQMPPPDTWLLVVWDGGRVDKAHTFNKWKHRTNPLGYLIQGHTGAHVDVTHWMPLPPPPGIVGKEGA